MKITELIAYADAVRPNAFDAATKIIWINEVEGMVLFNIMLVTEEGAKYYRYKPSAGWTGTGVSFPKDDTMLLPSACSFSIGGEVTISGLVTNAANNSDTARKILAISDDGTTLIFDDGSFAEGEEDSGTAAVAFDGLKTELLISAPHDKLYRSYLCAMIDFANGEYEKYNNGMRLFNAQYAEFSEWYIRTYEPADRG